MKPAALLVAVLNLALAFSAAAQSARGEIVEQVLVKVNGEIFTKTELEARQVATLRNLGQFDQASDPTGAQLRQKLNEITPELIVNVVDEMLMVQRGRDLGYKLSDEQFQSVLDSIKKDNNITTDEQFEAALKQENMTLADLRRSIERQMVSSRVQQNEVLGRVAVSEEEARRYYDSHLGEFTSPQTVTLREIFVTVPGDGKTVNVGQDEAASAKIGQIRQRAVAGENFEKLASDLSDAPSRANAGLIGPLNLDELAPDLRKRIEAMKVGDVSEILRSPRGYQILKLDSLSPAQTMPFEKAREEISTRIFTEKQRGEVQKFLETLRSQAIIEWKNDDLKRAYDAGLQQIKTARSSN
jgi:parvulin-like peptidyl-prolyl isomerase